MCLKSKCNLSILIPCYNFDITDLVKSINKLCKNSKSLKKFEILCFEDGSTKCFSNIRVDKLKNVKYHKLQNNIGRSKIRNMMAKTANYDWLLFIDCDSKIAHSNFIKNYTDQIHNIKKEDYTRVVLYGGTVYDKKPPKSNQKLHWKYGTKIETKRKKNSFSSHHFLISKKCFTEKNIQFNENINTYGYEDVLFIVDNKLKPTYIKNPLIHLGVKKTIDYIKDTESAIENLIDFYKFSKNKKKIKIIQTYHMISKLKLTNILVTLFQIFKPLILKNMKSNHPSLLLFQIYKIGFLSHMLANRNLTKKR